MTFITQFTQTFQQMIHIRKVASTLQLNSISDFHNCRLKQSFMFYQGQNQWSAGFHNDFTADLVKGCSCLVMDSLSNYRCAKLCLSFLESCAVLTFISCIHSDPSRYTCASYQTQVKQCYFVCMHGLREPQYCWKENCLLKKKRKYMYVYFSRSIVPRHTVQTLTADLS